MLHASHDTPQRFASLVPSAPEPLVDMINYGRNASWIDESIRWGYMPAAGCVRAGHCRSMAGQLRWCTGHYGMLPSTSVWPAQLLLDAGSFLVG